MAGLLILSAVLLAVASEPTAAGLVSSELLEGSNNDSENSIDNAMVFLDMVPFNETVCEDDEYYEPTTPECKQCKSYGERCEKHSSFEECCGAKNLRCKSTDRHYRCVCEDTNMEWEQDTCMIDYSSKLQFMTAAQVALGCALIIAVAALAALTCKMCTNRRRMEQTAGFHRESINSVSLNSVQRFVLGRMRDRPPRYDDVPDKPPEYDQEAPVAPLSTLPMARIPVAASRVPGRRLRLPPAAPPAYSEVEPEASTSSADTQPAPETSVDDDPAEASPETLSQPEPAEEAADQQIREPAPPQVDEPVNTISAPTPREEEGGVDNPAFTQNECHM